ncbi:Proprotein convertase subtilisin/kexin type 5 [Ceratobasidium theobromae]|uniref:Proprotein convertase subtilisin/kexin type 5 n=1 Tax=Ceratobasidium theobromae TaxID=1582974 RepID=A0A5N5QUR6_9AGAM|nr:Proprotein convertase subtilisin/kexin type 5 [Ceratobasidium theobromae]
MRLISTAAVSGLFFASYAIALTVEARDPGYYGGGGGGYGCTAGRGYSTYGGCIDCGANTYSPGAYSQCIGCPAWSTSGLRASSCTCRAGYYSSSGTVIVGGTCYACPAGYYSGPGANGCSPCPFGMTSLPVTEAARPARPVPIHKQEPQAAATAPQTPTRTPAPALAPRVQAAKGPVPARRVPTSVRTSVQTDESFPTGTAKYAPPGHFQAPTCAPTVRRVQSPTLAPSRVSLVLAGRFRPATGTRALVVHEIRIRMGIIVRLVLRARLRIRARALVDLNLLAALSPRLVLSGAGGTECIDILTTLDSCGGCVGPEGEEDQRYSGRDCTAIAHVDEVRCERGSCQVKSCRAGFEPSGGLCVEKAVYVGRNGTHASGTRAKRGLISHHDSF